MSASVVIVLSVLQAFRKLSEFIGGLETPELDFILVGPISEEQKVVSGECIIACLQSSP